MSPYFSGILLSYAAAVLGLMSPGPNILAVIGTSMGATQRMVTIYRRAQRWIEAALGAFFSFAGIKLLTSEI